MEPISNVKHGTKPDIVCIEGKGGYRLMDVIVLEHHPHDSRLLIKDDGICQTLNSRMGTGGGNVPLVLEVTDDCFAEKVQQCDGNGFRDFSDT